MLDQAISFTLRLCALWGQPITLGMRALLTVLLPRLTQHIWMNFNATRRYILCTVPQTHTHILFVVAWHHVRGGKLQQGANLILLLTSLGSKSGRTYTGVCTWSSFHCGDEMDKTSIRQAFISHTFTEIPFSSTTSIPLSSKKNHLLYTFSICLCIFSICKVIQSWHQKAIVHLIKNKN